MKYFQQLLVLFLLLIMSHSVLAVEKCVKTDIPSIDLDDIDAGSGKISFESVEICTSLSSSLKVEAVSGEGTVVYKEFSPSNRPNVSFMADGSHKLVSYADKDTISLTYMGGPVNYTVDEKVYEVFYQNLFFLLNLSGEAIETTGGVTINDQYFDGDSLPYEYFQIF